MIWRLRLLYRALSAELNKRLAIAWLRYEFVRTTSPTQADYDEVQAIIDEADRAWDSYREASNA